jgi:hypothetical protein
MQIKQGKTTILARLRKTEMADLPNWLCREFPIRFPGHTMGRLLPENQKWNTFLSIVYFPKHESLFWREGARTAHFF